MHSPVPFSHWPADTPTPAHSGRGTCLCPVSHALLASEASQSASADEAQRAPVSTASKGVRQTHSPLLSAAPISLHPQPVVPRRHPQDVRPFECAKAELEQYPTGPHLAACMLYTVRKCSSAAIGPSLQHSHPAGQARTLVSDSSCRADRERARGHRGQDSHRPW